MQLTMKDLARNCSNDVVSGCASDCVGGSGCVSECVGEGVCGGGRECVSECVGEGVC